MVLRFKIHYHTSWGEHLRVCGSIPELGNWDIRTAVAMTWESGGNWQAEVSVPDEGLHSFTYKYAVVRDSGEATWEWGTGRAADSLESCDITTFEDAWRPAQADENAWFSSAFTRVLMKRKTPGPDKPEDARAATAGRSTFCFQVYAPRIAPGKKLGIAGSDPALGNWDEAKAIVLDDSQYPLFRTQVSLERPDAVEYKYVILGPDEGTVETWEAGENHHFHASPSSRLRRCYVRTDNGFRYPDPWKGAGLAIPVFSLRSDSGMGTGEFADLMPLTDWAVETGMKMIQILPVNDTVATHTWKDSYPYAAISVFALHPVYMNLDELAARYDRRLSPAYVAERDRLNALPQIDYEAVMQVKSRYYKELYDLVCDEFLRDPAFQAFYSENKQWLLPYALFSYLRDQNGTPDFSAWPVLSVFDWEGAEKLVAPDTAHYDDIAIHYFIQYHLDRQLLSAARYARSHGVVIQGDIPIGIYRNSADAWVAPHLYHMDSQAGAPPDAYAVAGQNWRFPTYNWAEMARDGFAWWKWRLTHMARYFDAYRIDHILGFFRIWEIPVDSVQGLMGHFNPALPLYIHELESRGLAFDYERFCQPYIRAHFLEERFVHLTQRVRQDFLDEYQPDCFRLKPHFSTQRAIADQVETLDLPDHDKLRLRDGLFSLAAEVLFLAAPETDGRGFHPRIALHFTRSYQELDGHTQRILNEMYDDYFYHRHEHFWRAQAMEKLPAIVGATDMLVIGEDLGMVPDCVPGVMHELGLLSLEIQRMPKKASQQFVNPAEVPYLSVASPSCHDMSTIRGWWEEDRTLTEKYYHQLLGHEGDMPYFCEPWVAREINLQHLRGNSMWAIFPVQDLLAMDVNLRLEDPHAERINVPSNPEHYWRYRLHVGLERLLEETAFNENLRQMVADSGRTDD